MNQTQNNIEQTTTTNPIHRRNLAVAYISGMLLSLIIALIYLLYQLHRHNNELASAVKALAPQNTLLLGAFITGGIGVLVLNLTSRLTSKNKNETAVQHFWYSFRLHFAVCVISLSFFSLAVRHIF